eukprot:1936192-Pyramimonas_sp.AAC.1
MSARARCRDPIQDVRDEARAAVPRGDCRSLWRASAMQGATGSSGHFDVAASWSVWSNRCPSILAQP